MVPDSFASAGGTGFAMSGPRQKEPKYGEWPYWQERPEKWRNGREAGAHAAGLVSASPEKCGLVEVPNDFADGAALSMISDGLSVEAHSEGEKTRTFRVRAAWLIWIPADD